MQAAGGVDDEHVAPVVAGLALAELDDLRRGPLDPVGVHGHARLAGDGLELVDGSRAIDVGRHEQRTTPLGLEPARELAAEGGLARALQAQDHDGGHTLLGQLQLGGLAAEQGLQLLVDDLDDLLGRIEALEHVLAQRLLPHARHQGPGDAVVDVGLEQRHAHLAQRFLDVLLGQPRLAGQLAHGPFESPGEILEHGALAPRYAR